VATSVEDGPETVDSDTLRVRFQQALGDRFELGDKLGSGGFAHVYRARDLRLERDVAIKVLRPDLAQEPLSGANRKVMAMVMQGDP
jgi:serine/threonine protein kinase